MTSVKPTHEISVRSLIEQVFLTGSLSSVSFSGVSGIEGTRLHQKIFSDLTKENPGANVVSEFSLKSHYDSKKISLSIRGRADCVIIKNNATNKQSTNIIEIKSHNTSMDTYDDLFRPIHRAQLVMYAHMYLEMNPDLLGVNITLKYISIHTIKSTEKTEWISRSDAEIFFIDACKRYQDSAIEKDTYIEQRNISIQNMHFPYDTLRAGQKDFMHKVVSSILSKQILFAEAPTGIGKTIGTLFPSVKCIARGCAEKIFYVTAKTSARMVARKALSDMRESGLFMRSILLSAKEGMCPCREIYCEPKICIYANGYYDRLKAALKQILICEDIYPELIQAVAMEHCLCPHEFSLDVSEHCDVIIGDYNHAFHPKIRLDRYFNQSNATHIILADESHNLVTRSREMFSAHLCLDTVLSFQSSVSGMSRIIDGHTINIVGYFQALLNSILKGDSGLSSVETIPNEKDVIVSNEFRATKQPPKVLYGSLWRVCFHLSEMLDAIPVGPIRKTILDFYFESRFFLTVLEQYFDESYVYSCKISNSVASNPSNKKTIILSLDCLDASDKIREQIIGHHACVFFSATLSPCEYYRTMLLGKDAQMSDTVNVPSPFPTENLNLIVLPFIRTLYKERSGTSKSISDFIVQSISDKRGNYIVYLPSFDYLQMIYTQTLKLTKNMENVEIVFQTRDMSIEQKSSFLEKFNIFGNRTLLAFAVLGGHFSEGIDLVGEKLNGVFVIGVGLPQISPEREILCQYYQEKFGDGFSFAYLFPGWEKVLQACGRVIRDENDIGFAFLMDHRYARPEYQMLFPNHWNAFFAGSTNSAISRLSDICFIDSDPISANPSSDPSCNTSYQAFHTNTDELEY